VAAETGLPSDASLRQLADTAPAPWAGLLLEHRAAFPALTDEITTLVQSNRELLFRGQLAVREVLAGLADGRGEIGAGAHYGARPATAETARPLLIDEAL
jgi:hypothetical protein